VSLQLKYLFTSTPPTIVASAQGNAPLNVVNLEVTITNPTTSAIQLTAISIQIPCGGQPGEDADMLSDNPDLPSPDYDDNSGWSGSTLADTVSFSLPAAGIPGSGSFSFSLSGIQVDRTPGTVPITIVEDGTSKTIDNKTYALEKQTNTAPITSFYAQPATLNTVDETVNLFWECTAAGSTYAYCVHSDSWNTQQPNACLNNNTCNSCTDGSTGIQTGPVSETTVFYLDVIQRNNDGSRTIYQTNQTKVQMSLPTFSSVSYNEIFLSGRVLRLHWLAVNAAYCTVELDGVVIVNTAPIDTYEDGYWVVLNTTEAGLHQVTVKAYASAAAGSTYATHNYPLVSLDAIVTIQTNGGPYIAITPDGTKALVPTSSVLSNSIALVDIASSTVSSTLKLKATPTGVAITTDGTRAFVPIGDTPNKVIVIDLPGMTVEKTIPWDGNPTDIAITPDGTLALVSGINPIETNSLTVIDISSMTVEAKTIPVNSTIDDIAQSVVITPDGTLALTGNDPDTVTIVDIATRSAVTTVTVPTGGECGIAVTPDGKFALAANVGGNVVSLIDLASKSVVATIPVGNSPTGIAMLPIPNYGALGLVSNIGDSTISFIDIPNQVAFSTVLDVTNPWGIAVLPDGSHILITSNTAMTTMI
jgi:YVTN family beta-propeller protein